MQGHKMAQLDDGFESHIRQKQNRNEDFHVETVGCIPRGKKNTTTRQIQKV